MTNTKAKHFWAVAALLAVGLAVMLLYAGRKQGYHVDELYTYELANYPGGVTDPNYCVLKFTATAGRFYSDFYPRSFVIE